MLLNEEHDGAVTLEFLVILTFSAVIIYVAWKALSPVFTHYYYRIFCNITNMNCKILHDGRV